MYMINIGLRADEGQFGSSMEGRHGVWSSLNWLFQWDRGLF
jgi:hypothetical protein